MALLHSLFALFIKAKQRYKNTFIFWKMQYFLWQVCPKLFILNAVNRVFCLWNVSNNAVTAAFRSDWQIVCLPSGGTRDIGSALTRMCMRHRSIEAKLRQFSMWVDLCVSVCAFMSRCSIVSPLSMATCFLLFILSVGFSQIDIYESSIPLPPPFTNHVLLVYFTLHLTFTFTSCCDEIQVLSENSKQHTIKTASTVLFPVFPHHLALCWVH